MEEVDAPLDPNLPQPTPGAPPQLIEGCPTTIMDLDWKVGDPNQAVFGGTSSIEPMDPAAANPGDNAYMSNGGRARHNGPKFPTPHACVVPGANYFLSGRARFRSADGVTPPLCSVEGGSNGSYCLESVLVACSLCDVLHFVCFALMLALLSLLIPLADQVQE